MRLRPPDTQSSVFGFHFNALTVCVWPDQSAILAPVFASHAAISPVLFKPGRENAVQSTECKTTLKYCLNFHQQAF